MTAQGTFTVTKVDPIDEASAIVWLRGTHPGSLIRLTVRTALGVAHFQPGDKLAVDFTHVKE